MVDPVKEKAEPRLAEHLLCNEDLPPRHDAFRCLIHDRLEHILSNVRMLNTYVGKSFPDDPNKADCPQSPLADQMSMEAFLLEAPGVINETCRMIRSELEVFATKLFGYSSFLDIYVEKCEASNENALRHADLINSYNYIADLEVILKILGEKFHQHNSIDAQTEERVSEERDVKFSRDITFTGVFCPQTRYKLVEILNNCDIALYLISVRVVEAPEPDEEPA